MKFMESEFEGYIILVEEEDLKKPLDLPEIKGNWDEILWEAVSIKAGLYYAVLLRGNEFALEFIFPEENLIPAPIKANLEKHLI